MEVHRGLQMFRTWSCRCKLPPVGLGTEPKVLCGASSALKCRAIAPAEQGWGWVMRSAHPVLTVRSLEPSVILVQFLECPHRVDVGLPCPFRCAASLVCLYISALTLTVHWKSWLPADVCVYFCLQTEFPFNCPLLKCCRSMKGTGMWTGVACAQLSLCPVTSRDLLLSFGARNWGGVWWALLLLVSFPILLSFFLFSLQNTKLISAVILASIYSNWLTQYRVLLCSSDWSLT